MKPKIFYGILKRTNPCHSIISYFIKLVNELIRNPQELMKRIWNYSCNWYQIEQKGGLLQLNAFALDFIAATLVISSNSLPLAPSQLLRVIVFVEVKSAQISATTDRTPQFCKLSSFLKIHFKHSEVDKSVAFSIIE